MGRWLTPDPAGMIDGPNLYVYLNNNPINLIDPYGLCGVKQWWGTLVPLLQLSVSAINRGASEYFGQWANTIEEYAPGWTQGIAQATNLQNTFQLLGAIQGSLGYMDIYNKAQSQNLSTDQIRVASLIHGVGMGVKLLGTTLSAGAGGYFGGAYGAVGGAVAGGTAVSLLTDWAEKQILNFIGIQ